jgi:hypothetical protein
MVGLVTCGLGVLLAFILQHSYLKDVENAPSLLGGAGFVVRPLDSLACLSQVFGVHHYIRVVVVATMYRQSTSPVPHV